MTNKERLESLKPMLGGAVVGAIATLIVGFTGGWLVTSNTMADEVRSARVAAYGQACSDASVANWKGSGQMMTALDGWDNRDAREALAKRFIPAVSEDLTRDVQRACEKGIQNAI